MPELLDQYRLTDIRNVPQATVAHVNGPMGADPAVPTFQITYSDGSSVEEISALDRTSAETSCTRRLSCIRWRSSCAT